MFKFAIISFPGTNCETEAVRAFKRNGMEAEVVLWNDRGMLSHTRLNEFSGYCIAGGFSYEDRGRSGIIAAQDPIMDVLKKEADQGKIILGICNGAQILVETGLIPGFENKALGMALTWNEMKVGEETVETGYYCTWSYLKNAASQNRSAFNGFDELLHIPIAHGEGRFVMEEEMLKRLEENQQILFKYCDEKGEVAPHFPVTPNGAMASIAGLCNPAGNVMAIMPHPERDPLGNGNLIFNSIREYLEKEQKTEYRSLGQIKTHESIEDKKDYDLEIYIRLIITDNTERTLEETLLRKDLSLKLSRYEFYGIRFTKNEDVMQMATKILNSGELVNFNKHLVYLKMNGQFFQYDPQKNFIPKDLHLDHSVIVSDKKDIVGEAKKNILNEHTGHYIENIDYGVLWKFKQGNEMTMNAAIDSKVLYNPYSMILYK